MLWQNLLIKYSRHHQSSKPLAVRMAVMLFEEWTTALGFVATAANREQHCWMRVAVCARLCSRQ